MVTKSAKRITGFLGTSALTRPLFMLGAASALLGAGPAQALDANTLPQNPNVVGGKDSFHQSGNTLNVNQSTNRTVIDWRSFDIGSSAQVNFNQPGTSSIAVNRVNASANASQIEGGLHANGQVWILNPNGVFFGKTARVDAAGIVATTANIDANAFMAGSNKLQMTGADHGSVENQGKITVGANGLAAFVAPSVRNSGTINATVGRVALAAGTTYTLDLAGDHLVELGLGSVKAVVDSSGKIVNPGGTIALSAKAAGQVVNSVVNVSGVVTASSVTKSGGTITLGADNVTTTSTAQLSADAGTNGNGGAITSVANVQGNYAGSFSAQGGSASGNGGSVETSGKSVHVDDGIKVNTLASNGLTGSWTVDPENLTIGTTDSGTDTDTDQSISAATVESQLGTTSVNLKANLSITVNAAIDTSGQSNSNTLNFKDEDVDGLLTVNLNAPITLASTQHLTGDANIVNVAGALGGLIQNGVDVARSGGATVNVLAGTYNDPRVNISKDGIDLVGAPGATLVVPDISVANGLDAIDVWANDVTIEGLTILGPANSASGVGTSYQSFAWGNNVTRGIAIHNGAQNFSIHDNDIEGLRNDVLIDGRNTGTVYDNTLDNSKSGISVQYTDAGLLSGSQFTDAGLSQEQSNTVSIHDNQQGVFGNEWGANFHLNGHYDSSNGYHANGDKIATNATSTVQSALLAFQNANDGMTAQDQGYSQSNRTDVTVSMSGSDANQGSVLSTLKTIQGGVNAVVAGGTVNVLDGTYVVSAANGYTNGYLGISKSLNLVGQDEGGVIIDARNASSYGIRIIGGTDGVTLSNFTLWGVTAVGGYGVKAEDTTNLKINNVTSQGAYKAQFDLNGVRTGEVNNVVANGNGVAGGTGSTKGAAIAITDSQNVTVENSHIIGGSYGGIGIYQSNKADGYTYQAENITIADTNTYDANGVANYNYVYTEDESATNNFGTLNIEGFNTVAGLDANPSDTFKYFQNSKADAENYLDSLGAASLGYVEGWTGTAGTNNFSVDTVNGHAMSIQAAVNGAAAGATINVGAGTYTGDVTIAKSGIQLLSENGSGATTIQGVAGTSAEGAIFLTPGSDNTQIGDIGHGFKIVGFDSANPGTEVAAVYIQGANSGSKIIGNEITAAGDEAILTEYGAAVSGLTVDHNLIDGQTFVGPNPAGQGSSQQFTLWNVPRQAVVISTGSSNTTFTNNTITAVTGGLNASGQEQGNSLATIDSTGATITGNTFAGTTDYGSDALRARGTNTVISGNTFDGTNMAADTNMLEVYDTALSGTFDDLLANNTFTNGAVWFDHAVTGAHNEYYVFRGINSAVSKATAGDTVHALAGTYEEQVVLDKSITLEGAGVGQTIIEAPDTLSHSFTAEGTSQHAIISVENTSGVTISGLTVDGLGKGSGANTNFLGIGIYDSSATVDGVTVTRISDGGLSGSPSGVQSGYGIGVYNDSATNQTVTVENSTIDNFQKNGIAFRGENMTANILNNVVTGVGDTDAIAQNGIELYDNMSGGGQTITGTIQGNTVTDVSYVVTGANSPDYATGIYLIDTDNVLVQNNIVTGTGTGAASFGIAVLGSSDATLDSNTLSGLQRGISLSDQYYSGINANFGADNGVTVTGGSISGNDVGLFTNDAYATGLNVSGVGFAGNNIQFEGSSSDLPGVLANNTFDATAVDTNIGDTIFGDLQTAVGAASANDTLDVAGTFVTNGQVDINKNLTIAGLSGARATITSSTDQIGGNAANAWILVDPNVTFNLSNVVIDGSGHAIYQALRNEGNSTIDNVDFKNISGGAGSYVGEAIESFGGQVDGGAGSDSNGAGGSAAYLSVTNSTFENIGRIGILVKGDGSTADITGNTYTGKGAGDWLDYGIEVGAGGSASIHGNTITGALGVASVDGSTSAGIIVTTYYGAGTQATIGNNTITGNTAAVDVGYDDNDTSNVRAFSNDFSGNGVELESTNATQDFTGNYWGTTDETAVLGLMSGVDAGSVNFSTFLTNGTDADPASLGFQGDFSHLIVTSLGGGTNRLGEAVSEINAGGTINVNAGTYTLPGTLYIDKSLSLVGAGEGTTTIDGSGISNNFAMRVRADDVSLSGFTVSGPGGISVYSQSPTILHDASISHVTIDVGTAGYTGLTVAYTVGANVDHVTVDGTATGGAGSTGVQIIDASDVTLTNVKTFGNQAGLGIFEDDATGPQVNNINVDTTNSFLEDEPVFIVDTASANGPSLGSVNIQGFKYAVGNQADFGFGPGYLLNDQQTAIDDAAAMDASSSTVQGWTGTGVNNVFTVGFATDGTALSINTAANAATAGGAIDVNSGTYAEDVAIGKQLTFNFDGATVNSFTLASGAAGSVLSGDLTATGAIAFNGATSVTGDLKAASITATDAFALNGNAAASGAIALNGATTLAGNLTGGSIALGATTLTGNTSLDTSAANGAIKVASVNGATAGGQSLAIKAGTGSVSLGNAGATTRLGAVSDASKTTLTGSTYNANSFLFGGDVTLTSADTTLNTTQSAGAAGDITFQGDLFGTTDGSQSLTLIAGPGTGAASANGDILLQNAGTTAVNLNNLTVSGDDFTALTVDLAGNYNSLLTGNQVFAADTLNVKGNANSIVGGDASGHIVASGDVTIAAGGDVSGTISGENVNLTGDDVNSVVTANNAANIKGNTVEGSYTADTVTLIASNNVDAAVDATDFVLAANHGSVDGTWTTINTDGSNVVSVNGQTTVGMANVNPNQLVVEGFVLPAGTTIGANGQLILPEGTLLGLLSPGGGKPKMILVHTVHQLGELLASGYSVIVIDLSGHGKEKLVQLAAN